MKAPHGLMKQHGVVVYPLSSKTAGVGTRLAGLGAAGALAVGGAGLAKGSFNAGKAAVSRTASVGAKAKSPLVQGIRSKRDQLSAAFAGDVR